jgi:hypothetical protein
MYLERLKRVLSTERRLRLTFSSGDKEESIEMSPEAADQTLHTLQIATSESAGEEQLTLMVLGHQVVRTPEAYGLLLHTQEFGDVVFSLPQEILQRLVTDLVHLASSAPVSRASGSRDATAHRVAAWERVAPRLYRRR